MLVSTHKSALGILVDNYELDSFLESELVQKAEYVYKIPVPLTMYNDRVEVILLFDFDIKKTKLWEENSFEIEKYDYGYVKFDVWAENVEKYSNAENPTLRDYLKNSIPIFLDFDMKFLEEKQEEYKKDKLK